MRRFEGKTNACMVALTAIAIVLIWGVNLFGQEIDTVFCEDFENGWGDWFASNGVWDIGPPDSGPDSAYSGDNCAGTVLDGNYPNNVRSRLISPPFIVPSAVENPRLKFWHWYIINGYDYGAVQIKVDHADSNWVEISDRFDQRNDRWTQYIVDLREYAGETVRIAFYFYSNGSGNNPGWYVDDVCLITGDYVPNLADGTTESFEDGWRDWYASNGVWGIGVPDSGAYSGDNCAGTVLDGNYPNNVRSRLISPPFIVPSTVENPRLKFWHWYIINGYDYGAVQIKVDSPDSNWVEVSDRFDQTNTQWTQYIVPLSEYEGETVRIAFYFYSNGSGNNPGWYVDDIRIATMTSVDNLYESIPSNFALVGNYPNPFNASTSIAYTLSTESTIRLDIYNLLGQRVVTLFEGRQQAGKYTITWDASGFPSGVYFARLETAERSESIKMLFLK